MVEHFHGKEGVAGSSPAPGLLRRDPGARVVFFTAGQRGQRRSSLSIPASFAGARTPEADSGTYLNLDMSQTRLQRAIRRGTGRLALLGLATALLAALVLPGTALGARGLTTGFQSDYYQDPDAGIRNFWLNKTLDTGAGIVRLNVPWLFLVGANRPIDPTNPGSADYNFSLLDESVRDARAHGLEVMLIASGAPSWAEGPGKPADAVDGSWRPNPNDFADFAQALANRYSGNFDPDGDAGPLPPLPAAQALEVWNEPNTSGAISPQFEGKTDVAAGIYRDLLNAAYDGVKRVNPKMLVVTGGTDPYGDPPGGPYPPGIQRVRPVTFWEDVLCVQPVKGKKKKKGKKPPVPRYVRKGGCNGPVKFDVFAHHPISNTGKGPLEHGPDPDDASTPDLGRVVNVLRGAEKAGTTLAGRHPVWVTEFWWDSKPPNPSGAPLLTQARWIEQSLYLFWKAGADTAINFVVGDTSVRPTVHAGFQGGVYFQDGRPKPSLTAYQFPFVTSRVNRTTLQAWGKSPAAGKLLIQRKQGGWHTIKRLSVGKGSVFVTKLKLSGKQLLRAKVAGRTSLTWKQAAFGGKASSSDGGLSGWKIVLLVLVGLVLLLVAAGALRRRQVVRRRRDRRGSRLRHQIAATSGRPS